MDNVVELIGEPKGVEVELEFPATFSTTLFFINNQGEYTTMDFGLPPGIYPNPEWMTKLLPKVYATALNTLKMSTKDLSWRKCSPIEFVKATAGGQKVKVRNNTWAAPCTVKRDFVEAKTDDKPA